MDKKKIKHVIKEAKESAISFITNINRCIKYDICSRNEAIQIIRTNPSMSNLFRIQRYEDMAYSKTYTVGSTDCRIIELKTCDSADEWVKRNKWLENLVVKAKLHGVTFFSYDVEQDGKMYDIVTYISHKGNNGSGDFVENDMKEIIDEVRKLRKNGAPTAGIEEVFVDPLDDVSDWLISFTFDAQAYGNNEQ